MSCVRFAYLIFLVLTAGCAGRSVASQGTPVDGATEFGALVMAHGGSPEWNAGILAAVEPLSNRYPIEVAFGMADAATMQEALQRLEARGAMRIGVVRLFISGESWYERTEQILGLSPAAPPSPEPTSSQAHGDSYGVHGQSMELSRVQTEASFTLSTQGLAEAEAMGTVVADRTRALSRDPQREDVLILAHGPGSDSENERWMAWLDARAQTVREALPFRRVEVMTLREDWPEKRPEAERRIRSFVETAREDGITTIVIPFRVYGFGAYAEVLQGLDYVSDGQGLIPHAAVTGWIGDQLVELRQGPFRSPVTATGPPTETGR